jgi:putative transposase
MALSIVDGYDTPGVVEGNLDGLRGVHSDGPRLPLAEPVLDEAAAREATRRAVAELLDKQALDAVLAQVKSDGLRLTGPVGSCRRWSRRCWSGGCRPS